MRSMKTMAVGVLAAALLAGAGMTAFATGGTGKPEKGYMNELTEEQKAEHLEKMQERTAKDLAEGKITQEQYDKMIETLESGEFFVHGRDKSGTLTDEQKAEMLEKMKGRLTEELAEGKITQNQYDEILSTIENGEFPDRGRREGKKEKTELTDEQKAEMLEKIKVRLAEELAEGKITQDQYDRQLSNLENGTMPMRLYGKGWERETPPAS